MFEITTHIESPLTAPLVKVAVNVILSADKLHVTDTFGLPKFVHVAFK